MEKAINAGVFIIMGAAMTACSATSKEIYAADGRKGHIVTCSGAGVVGAISTSWGQCYEKAGQICGARGFDIKERTGEMSQHVVSGDGYTAHSRMMIIQCKG